MKAIRTELENQILKSTNSNSFLLINSNLDTNSVNEQISGNKNDLAVAIILSIYYMIALFFTLYCLLLIVQRLILRNILSNIYL